MKYAASNLVPDYELITRALTLAEAFPNPKRREREFVMPIPARADHDADIVLAEIAIRLDRLRAEAERLEATAREVEWRSMESAPRDGTPILGWCRHEDDPYVEDEKTGRLTNYGAWCEGGSRVEDGAHVLVWGGGFTEDQSGEGWGPFAVMPDWWFLDDGGDYEKAANPVLWKPIREPQPDCTRQRALENTP